MVSHGARAEVHGTSHPWDTFTAKQPSDDLPLPGAQRLESRYAIRGRKPRRQLAQTGCFDLVGDAPEPAFELAGTIELGDPRVGDGSKGELEAILFTEVF